MIITYLRSSSYNTWKFCQHKYMIDYTLGWRSPANQKAEKGTIVHKALEMLARAKLAKQNLHSKFKDDELGEFHIDDIHPDIAIQLAYHHISEKTKHLYQWNDKDFNEVRCWFYEAINYKKGLLHPYNQNIISPEIYFDITIKEPWAFYHYKMSNGQELKGYLSIKGTLDLVIKLDDNTYELIDYKTGKRVDWNTGEEKNYDKLLVDTQLRLYHYALCYLFPDIEHFIISIFYINDGGLFSMNYERSELKQTENMIKKTFIDIRNNYIPKTIYPNWKCTKLCYFGRHDLEGNPISKDDYKTKSICQNIKKDLLTLGMDRVMLKHSKSDVSEYGAGGGRTNPKY